MPVQHAARKTAPVVIPPGAQHLILVILRRVPRVIATVRHRMCPTLIRSVVFIITVVPILVRQHHAPQGIITAVVLVIRARLHTPVIPIV